LASRRIPGFALSEHHDAELATAALQMAVAIRGGDVRGVIFHSDKGSEYTASAFEGVCVRLGITQSMGRVGSALDNAAAESFNSTLEWELLSRQRFVTKVQARRAVAGFIDRYNRLRRQAPVPCAHPSTSRPTWPPRQPMSTRRHETAIQEARHGPQSSRVVSECPAMTCSTNYPEASTLRGEAQSGWSPGARWGSTSESSSE